MNRQEPLSLPISEAKRASFRVDSLPYVVLIMCFLNGAKAFNQRLIAVSLVTPHHGSRAKQNLRLVGSHAGVEIGADGPSQMGLEDLAMMRTIHGSTVLYPSDACSSDYDDVTLIGAGVTLHACLHAADALEKEGVHARVIDCYSIKPIDTATLTAAADATGGRLVITEDHHPEGGLGSAVTDALLAAGQSNLTIAHLAVRGLPGSGSSAELMAWAGIDADHIATAARQLIGNK